jgi:hypothetical protein
VEKVAEVMKANKVSELFQIMVIVNLNMGNFTLKVNTLKKHIGYEGEGEGNVTRGIG